MPPSKQLRITESAKADLLEIRTYGVEQWGLQAASAYFDNLRDAFLSLRDMPGRGRARPEIAEGLFSLTVGRHILFYRIDDTLVSIIRVLHQAMDVERHLDHD